MYISTSWFLVFMPSASSCELIEVEMCLGLSYNLTSFPNIWLSIADQREAATLLRQYRVKTKTSNLIYLCCCCPMCYLQTLSPCAVIQVLMELACFKPLQRLVCGMFLPQCSPQGGVLQPCRSVCSSAEQQCSQALDLLSFSWPFNCHLLPDSQDPMECSLPWCKECEQLRCYWERCSEDQMACVWRSIFFWTPFKCCVVERSVTFSPARKASAVQTENCGTVAVVTGFLWFPKQNGSVQPPRENQTVINWLFALFIVVMFCKSCKTWSIKKKQNNEHCSLNA